MNDQTASGSKSVLERIRAQCVSGELRVTVHAHQEMVEENIALDEVLQAAATAQIIENYPEHRRGACCLLNGLTQQDRPLHIVCTTTQPVLIIITVYEPKPPRWITPTRRRNQG